MPNAYFRDVTGWKRAKNVYQKYSDGWKPILKAYQYYSDGWKKVYSRISIPSCTVIPVISPEFPKPGETVSSTMGTWLDMDNDSASDDFYTYQWQISSNGTSFTNISGKTGTTKLETHEVQLILTPEENYDGKYIRIKVTAENSLGSNIEYSSSAYVAYDPPNAPTGLSISNITGTSFSLQWNAPATGPQVDYYKVAILAGTQSNADGVTEWISKSPGVFSHSFTGLSPLTTYTAFVRGVNSGGDGAYAKKTDSTVTNTPDAPTITNNSYSGSYAAARINFISVAGCNSYLIKFYSPSPGYAFDSSAIVNSSASAGTSLYYDASVLSFGADYKVSVTAYTGSGGSGDASSESAKTSFSTVPSAPSLSISATSQSYIDVSWSSVSTATSYSVSTDGSSYTNIGNLTSRRFSSLSAGQSYTFYVYANNANGHGPASTISASTAPATPSISATSITSSSASLSWSATGASSYKVDIYRTADSNATSLSGFPLNTSSTSTNVSSLIALTSYTVIVTAYSGSSQTGSSSANSATFSTIGNPPASPSPSISSRTSSAITFAWSLVSGATSYSVSTGGGYSDIGNTSSYTLSGLSAGSSYTLYVIANNSYGSSSAGSSSGYTSPGTPSISISSITKTTASVSWSASGASTYYVDVFKSSTGVSASGFPTTTSATSASVSGLTHTTGYTVSVVAYSAGSTSASNSSSFTTAAPITPGTPTITTSGVTTSAFDVSWTATNASTYNVDIYKSTTGLSVTGFPKTATTTTSASITGLTASTQYSISVTAISVDAVSSAQQTASVTTATPTFNFTPFNFVPTFNFTPFNFTPFNFVPFNFTPFNFTPFEFTPVFSFAPSKCIHEDTLIKTPDGLVPAKNVYVGSKVYSVNLEEVPLSDISGDSQYDYSNFGSTSLVSTSGLVETTIVSAIQSVKQATMYFNNEDDVKFSLEQPMFIKRNGDYEIVPSGVIDYGDYLISVAPDGSLNEVLVESITIVEGPQNVYLFDCEPQDWFIAGGYLVHNK